jgi:signal transduction histidine kinase/ligand-binding sensor domain-containing protein/CheY-like chemotaxis protein/HPt (histidine-containing phosphotransfer) domain-containing protein
MGRAEIIFCTGCVVRLPGRLYICFSLLCILLYGSLGAAAALAAAPARTLRFDQLGVEQGLPQESVLAIVQDAQGFMWFGSQGGLTRYDGYRTVTYKSNVADERGLADNWVRALHLDQDGNLWIGTDGGLDRFDSARQEFIHYRPREPGKRGNGNLHVRAILGDGAKGLWIASTDGLQHLDTATGRFTIWHRPDGLADEHVNALARDNAGRLWIATDRGLDMLAPGAARIEHFDVDSEPGSKENVIQALLVDPDQQLWLGTQAGTVERWKWNNNDGKGDGKGGSGQPQRTRLSQREGLHGSPVTALYRDSEANLWAGSDAGGLLLWQPSSGRFAQYSHVAGDNHSVADNKISALYRDRFGTLWVGTWYAGVSRVDLGSGGFARYVRIDGQPHSLTDNRIRAISTDGHGKLWLGTNGGLNSFDPETGEARLYPQGANDKNQKERQVNALWRGRDGTLWTGGETGVSRFDPARERFTSMPLAQGDPAANNIRAITGDLSGNIWISSRGGLHRFDPSSNTVRTFRHAPGDSGSLADDVVRPVLEDRAGRLWVGTFNGLDLLDRATGRFQHFRHDPADPGSLSHNEVHALLEDSQGGLWIGTANGLNRMVSDPSGHIRFRRYMRRDGLADDAISAILPGPGDEIWLSTNTGISRLRARGGEIRNYGGADGAVEGAYFDGAALRAADGTLYFGAFAGLTGFLPSAVRDNQGPPPVVITDFQIFNRSVRAGHGEFPAVLSKPVEQTAALTLGGGASVISLEFAALHYASPERNLFAYQLQGFDRDWVMTDASKRFATYTNLDPGEYVFRVTAANKDGRWNQQGATLAITILPPLWKTWWFRTLMAALALGAGYGLYRRRMHVLERQKGWLEEQVGMRTAEVEQKSLLLQRQKQELDQRRIEAESQRAEAEQRRRDAERQTLEVERQKENVEQAHRSISVLSEIGREMTATLDIEKAMSTVYRHVHQLMDAGIFGIGFYREEQQVIEFPFSIEHGVRSHPYTRSLKDPNQFAVWCLTHRREIFINDCQAEYADYIGVEGLETLSVTPLVNGSRGAIPQSMMYTPLLVNDRVVGVMAVQSAETNAYRPVHLDMLQTLAAHAAVGLDNARAYQQLEAAMLALRETQAELLQQQQQVRLHTEELAQANRALQENDERLRLAKQKAEDATRQKSEFLANMSHEMRTPLAGVIGMLGFALRDRQLRDGTREQILRGQANAQSLLTIINDLLDFSKIEAGKLSIEKIDFTLGQAVGNVVALFEEQAAAQSLEFNVHLAEDLPKYVVGDPMRLRQVLVNLIGNAFKFTERGLVQLRVERVAAANPPSGPNLIRFVVRDSGIGIPREALPRLFQKFEQADASTTRRYGGTGLGLAICRQLVELMGGDIAVESTPGQGSTFTFIVPLANGVAPPSAPMLLPRAPHSHRLEVLCAEDFPTNQIIIRMMLEDMGHRVDIAANGLLALAACACKRYDLILMDGRMPEMDGADAARLIRAGGTAEAPVQDADVTIIALTANASNEDRNRYLDAGMNDFLTKPIDEATLHDHLARTIDRQLRRGITLQALAKGWQGAAAGAGDSPALAGGHLTTAELDAMFDIDTTARPAVQRSPATGGDLRSRIRNAFAGDVGARIAELDFAIDVRDSDRAARLLHGIKGSCAYLEEPELHSLCGALEHAADSGDWPALDTALPDLRRKLLAAVEGEN